MASGTLHLEELLMSAQKSVRLIGVVPFDIEWASLAEAWAKRLRQDDSFRIVVLCESDNLIFSKSFTTDTDTAGERRSYRDMKFVRDQALDIPGYLRNHGATPSQLERVKVEIMHLPIPIVVAAIDSRLLACPWLHEPFLVLEEIGEAHPWRQTLDAYTNAYVDRNRGGIFACSADDEVLELYDHERIPRGIFPRQSFYDTDFAQLVVWALIFDRRGRLLIHKRSENAKDNRGMWDKSVGGHVDYRLDVDTSRAIVREVVEELFQNELKQRDIRTWDVTDRDMIYVGEWRPEQRRRHPFEEIKCLRKEWAYFRLKDSQPLFSPRTMPDSSQRRLRVIADVFLFVAGPDMTRKSLGDLENSQYSLVELGELKTAMDKAFAGRDVPGFDAVRKVPLFTPDLVNIMTGELKDVLVEFSNFIKRYVSDN